MQWAKASVGDGGYTTTVKEDEFPASALLPSFSDLSFGNQKDASHFDTPTVLPNFVKLLFELIFPQQLPTGMPPNLRDDPNVGDVLTAARFRILIRVALQQTQLLH